MSIRPRYSLLTLLLLTALVAGGVKLWYGPHHLVEWTASDVEEECMYTRDWRGEKILDGPTIWRTYDEKKLVSRVMIGNYRNGEEHQVLYIIYVQPTSLVPENRIPHDFPNNPMNEAETAAFYQVVERESQRIRDQGHFVQRGFIWPNLIQQPEGKSN